MVNSERQDGPAGRTGHSEDRTLGFFITRVIRRPPGGRRRFYSSRSHRKGLLPVEFGSQGAGSSKPLVPNPWLRWWAPHRLSWWVAVLFIVGSTCFALGSFAANWPRYAPSGLADSHVINGIFFIGSLFFTSAAWLQLLEAGNGDLADLVTASGSAQPDWRWFPWRPRNAGYLASLIQLIGTLLFNFNTADALLSCLSWSEDELLIWGPDIIGSLCFLISSYLAVIEVSHGVWSIQPRQLSWWVVILNLSGSLAFMRAALAGFYPPSSTSEVWAWGANTYTLIGALCFFSASYLMIPELFGAGQVIGSSTTEHASARQT